ncbi:MAG TPA: CRISPR-associated endoribonuclease Cas6 [Thermotoga sp.]|uniref:CRISPR-associated endoribonuclease Cas6 n=1 Tax=Thermotoga sp. (strain RQ2) TaxID=126740 RepID=UPI000160170C|nr:CRISPR-associated endoribonuclease Cas6 [Thermotoga sp. RQ2]ACB09357.1 CRISPR-associated protein Cas6 [Thermotoga sp. RQ2]HBF69784.1 CRISPR-associated endoribonuclease Cas6 [Thermotoga sp.]
MRLKVSFQAMESTVPLNYNYFLSSFIYKRLASQNENFARFLHEKGYGKRFKFFTFSQLFFENSRVSGERIFIFPGKGWWYISSPVVEFVRYMFSSLSEDPVIRVGKTEFIVKSIDIENSLPDQSEYHFIMLSPLVVSVPEENNGKLYHRYLHPEEEEFYEVFRKNLMKKYRAFYGKDPEGTVEVIPDWDYIKSRHRITKRIKLKNAFVRAVVFPFKIRGEKKLVEIGYEAGFGEKNSMGFGMVALKKYER